MNFLDAEVVATFQEEAAERLTSIENGLLSLEKKQTLDAELMRQVFRDAHSLKAAANLLGFQAIDLLAHQMESTMDRLMRGNITASGTLYSLLLSGVDSLRDLTQEPDADPSQVSDLIAELRALTNAD